MEIICGIEIADYIYDIISEYDGADQSIEINKFCDECHSNENTQTFRCSRCMLVRYCSKQCQKNRLSCHKDLCKEIKISRKKVSEFEVALRGGEIKSWDDNLYTEFNNERINFFNEPYLGHWWGYIDPRDYCREVRHLSELIKSIAWDYEAKYVWKECLDLKLSLLRYNINDNLGIRYEVPSVLLYMNEDDKCYKFIKWWSYSYNNKYLKSNGNDDTLLAVWGNFV